MKLRERIGALREVRVPHTDSIPHAELAHQQAVHPPECKLHELDTLLREMLMQWRVDTRDEFGHAPYRTLYTRLSADVVVLDSVQQASQAPERVCLSRSEYGWRQDSRIRVLRVRFCGGLRETTVLVVVKVQTNRRRPIRTPGGTVLQDR